VAPWTDGRYWTRLAGAGDAASFAAAWLAIQCQMLPGIDQGVVVFDAAREGALAPIATWPEGVGLVSDLMEVAELALHHRQGAVRTFASAAGGQRDALAYPLIVDERLYGVAAIAAQHRGEGELPGIMRQLQWGCAWLELLVRRGATSGQLSTVLDLAVTALTPPRFRAAATAVATALAAELDCERVAIGFTKGRQTRVCALSNSADFDLKSGLLRGLTAAMDEALDQQDMVVFPESPERPPLIVRAHAALLEQQGAGAVCTVPLTNGDQLVGAVTLERRVEQPFSHVELALCEQVAALIGPLLEAKRRDDRWIGFKLTDAARGGLAALLGAGHLGLKLGLLVTVLLSAFLSLAQGEFRVRAPATLEGLIQRSVTAPIDGYVATAPVRAGDIVTSGDLVMTLEDKDLRLERVRIATDREKLEREHSQSLAENDRAGARILGARIDQAQAQLRQVDEKLARTRVTAPFAGIVVSGDLTQSLGAPVSRGDVLFQVAPLDSYRVRLTVDEEDIPELRVGQAGRLALTGLPERTLPIRLTKITPVSKVEQGRNVFVVEAALEETPVALRPGMAGIGKIDIGRRNLAWIWTHRLVHWVRLWSWSWLG
jgi:RND family efflux transporter MFP subunit